MYKEIARRLLVASSVTAAMVGVFCVGYLQLGVGKLTDLQASTDPVSTWENDMDTEAPILSLASAYVRTNQLSNLDVSDIVKVEDQSETTVRIGHFRKISDLMEITSDTLGEIQNRMQEESSVNASEDATGVREAKDAMDAMELQALSICRMEAEPIPTEEGIYTAYVYAWDEKGNQSSKEILVLYDRSGPTIAHSSEAETMEVSDINQIPEVSIDEEQIFDAVDGTLSDNHISVDVAPSDEANHIYTVTIRAWDYGRNQTTLAYPLTLVQKPEETPEEATDDDATGSDVSVSNKSNTASSTIAADTTSVSSAEDANPVATTSAGTYNDAMESEVLGILNQRRAEAGLSPLSMNATLSSAARVRAEEITDNFAHVRRNGSSPSTAITEAGGTFQVMGENIAAGQTSATSVMDSWMASPGHAANILDGSYGQVGIACYVDSTKPYKYYWVQIFTN